VDEPRPTGGIELITLESKRDEPVESEHVMVFQEESPAPVRPIDLLSITACCIPNDWVLHTNPVHQ
jgi:hypothetical protein